MHGWDWLLGLSVTRGPLHLGLVGGAVAALAGLLLLRRTRTWWLRVVPVAALVASALLGAVWLVVEVTRPWPDGLPPQVLAWLGVALLAAVLVPAGWRRQRWRVRGLAVLAAGLAVLGAADGVDAVFGAYPTIASTVMPPSDAASAATVLAPRAAETALTGPLWQVWHPPADLPAHGAVTQVDIPATRSGFPARPAWLYVPPAYLTARPPQLPVLMLIGGQPGTPRDWLDGGLLAQRMDDFAAAHGGLAPIVVMPDALGGPTANPLCTDSALGRADTYLAQDVVTWARGTLRVDPEQAHWAVGGFSYGGTCALQLAVAHPDLFPTFYDSSGQRGPTLGSPARTVTEAFHGDRAAYTAADPLTELSRRTFPGSAGFLVVGAQDSAYRPQQRTVAAAARAAGMIITTEELPGGHAWPVAGRGFTDALPWLATRMGLAP